MQATRSHRGLSTARAALSVTWLLARAPDGVRADEVAVKLGKSVSTAYNLLASLCDEGVAERLPGGLYHLAPGFRETVAEESDRHNLSGVVDDLLARTHKRAYLAVLRGNQLKVILERGLQGMPKLPNMSPEIRDNAHALALGKVVLARAPADALERYLSAGLKRFTEDTITDPDVLRTELRRARRDGIAVDREEIAPDFCCIAAPLLDEQRRFLGAVGISMSVRAFDAEREALTETLRDIVGFQSCADRREVLDPTRTAGLASGSEHLAVKRRMRQRR
ncbi:helix-turn-helix domain-containing protein [Solirubrobacter ginsenosidimutans]|uniref:Helix-turn-helix domain-containing protein n=1 Tax=Solirubrobacter ginsenosidimutans TaxID=490573 RepID=A0A9X3MR68_9ACTN|nr:IclR family transcriptional regulator C-terminal domain-containing protein [Solirubrobacter ginsenosidimutans]MDA0161034.1 helix-turn-helix domain-containing protein [Solirubrobacter ginsenosidimutans]